MDYGYESDDLEDFIRPTKKNRRILIGFYIFIASMICVLSYIQLVTAEYANDIKDVSFGEPYGLFFNNLFTLLFSIFMGVGGIFLSRLFYWKICIVSTVSSLILSLLADMYMLLFFPDRVVIILVILIFICEILCDALFIMLMVAFAYQITITQKGQSLQLEDPDSKVMHDLFVSLVRIIPGLSFIMKKTGSNTKSQ